MAAAAEAACHQQWVAGEEASTSHGVELATGMEPHDECGKVPVWKQTWLGMAHCQQWVASKEAGASCSLEPAMGMEPCDGHGEEPAQERAWHAEEPAMGIT